MCRLQDLLRQRRACGGTGKKYAADKRGIGGQAGVARRDPLREFLDAPGVRLPVLGLTRNVARETGCGTTSARVVAMLDGEVGLKQRLPRRLVPPASWSRVTRSCKLSANALAAASSTSAALEANCL